MGNTALITGCTGQDGSYLSELLLNKGYKVYGMIRRSSVNTTERIAHLIPNPNFELVNGDITDASCMFRIISGIKPDEVYNLAAMSHVGVSFDQPVTTCAIDAIGPLNILEAIRQFSPRSKYYQAGSSEIFGNTTISPQNEFTPFNPNSPYAVAKLYAHHLVGLYRRAYGIFACAGILFNHESPRRGHDFVTRKISLYVASLKKLMDNNNDNIPIVNVDVSPLYLGNINAMRDWSHASDMVLGMWMMMQYSEPDDYVLGSEERHSVKHFADVAFKRIGLDYKKYVRIDKTLYRPADVNLLHADASKAKRVLGWNPRINFKELVKIMVDYDCGVAEECLV